MSFTLAATIVLALIAVGLGLTIYHLLGRLEMLEQAVQGGLEPPTTRLTREQFERRFRTAHARSALARETGTGVVLVVGAEYTDANELRTTVEGLSRRDLFRVLNVEDINAEDLGLTTTPYLFIIDDARIRAARPVSGPNDVITALKDFA